MRLLAIAAVSLLALTGLTATAGATDGRVCTIAHHARCAGADLARHDLRGADLRHATLRRASLHHADLRGAVLHHADLRGAVLHHVDLRGADLEYADLRGVDLRHADLRGARLRGARLHHLPGRASASRRPRATPSCAPDECVGADLSYADLTGAVLNATNLSYASLVGANLTGAQLRSADLWFADLTGAVLTATDFTGALDCSMTVPPGVLAGRGCADDPTTAPVCYAETTYSSSTGTFIVTGNTFMQQSSMVIPGNDTQITSLTVEAWIPTSSANVTSSGRSFTVAFSGATTGTFAQTLTGQQNPWTGNSGPTHRSLAWNVADTGYDVSGAGRIRVSGAGTIGTWSANPDQRISVIVHITGTTRTATPCS